MTTVRILAKLALLGSLCYCQLAAHSARAADAPAGEFRTPAGFTVDMIYSVPSEQQGSWVSLCVDPKGRIIASDQYGKLYRVTLKQDGPAEVEQLQVNIGLAQGMLCAFDALYININARKNQLAGTAAEGPGVYRLTDTTGDDQYDKIEYIVPLADQAGEHGPHALILSPDQKQIYFCSGNQTDFPETASGGPVPRNWGEDPLLGRMPDGRGFMRDRMAPGGWICRMDPDGSNIELVATGFRNEYDIAFNPDGELFTYDADMEWDIGTPWYRPTRVNHVISGAEFGWRNGTGKWPEYYGDSWGAVANVGPGSPTGIVFGTGAKFPQKYQDALFISDWSYGVIYAVNMKPAGATYTGEIESFVTAAPMAVTDLVIHPDGNMYFAVGGRKTASELYRVRYTGSGSTAPSVTEAEQVAEAGAAVAAAAARRLRHQLEVFHGSADPRAIKPAIEQLSSPDRAIRFAARIALEHQPVAEWREQALAIAEPRGLITAAYALARSGSQQDQAALIDQLTAIDFAALPEATQLELLRAYELVWLRLAPPSDAQRTAVLKQLDAQFPSRSGLLNRELAVVLCYLKAPEIVARCVDQLRLASAQEDQIHYAFCLRGVETGWTVELRQAYFQWFFDVASARGGASFGGFLSNIRDVALDKLSESQRQQLGKLAGPMPAPTDPLTDFSPRQQVAQWSVASLQAELEKVQTAPNFERGRELTAVGCCLTWGDEPGRIELPAVPAPPALTQASQFTAEDSLEIGQESSADARECLKALAWPREQFSVQLQEAGERQGNWLVRFPSARPVGDPVNDLAAMEWYQACDADGQPITAPAMVIVHESGSGMTVGRLVAKSLRSKGIHTFMLQLPYYGVRRTADAKPHGRQITEALCQSVVDARRARDAVACLPYVDARCVCLQGTSLGGFVTATTAGLDQAYQHVFVLLAGGDLHGVLMEGQKDAAKVRQAIMADGMSDEQFQAALRRIEPLRLAHRVDPARVWLFSGRYDDVVPPKSSLLYAQAAGLVQSHHIQLMANHYSGIIFLPLISEQMSQVIHGEAAKQ